MKVIAFHDNNLCLRGTTNAMYGYANYNEKILGNKSIIISSPYGNLDSLEKFQKRFEHVILTDFCNYDSVLSKMGVDYLYVIKSGGKSDGIYSELIPTLIHVVFRSNEPHGYRYKYISDWLARDQGYDPLKDSIPHIVERLPHPLYNLRESFNISKNSTVFGYLGGATEFNIGYVQEAIKKIVAERNDIYFIFRNVNRFNEDNNPNIIYLPGTWDLHEKSAFINACDAMIHARYGGETFGCAVAEFTIMNKPVVTCKLSGERAHIEILEDRGIYYSGFEEVYNILSNIKNYIKYDDYYKAYNNYSPENIMDRFNKNFLN